MYLFQGHAEEGFEFTTKYDHGVQGTPEQPQV